MTEEQLRNFGACIARHMNGWAVSKVMSTAFHLSGPDGMRLVFWAGAGKGREERFEVSGKFDLEVYVSSQEEVPAITVAATRPAGQIAKDVGRRLLCKYIPLYYKKLKQHQEIMQNRDARERVMQTLADAFGWKMIYDRDGLLKHAEESYGGSQVDANYTTKLEPDPTKRRWEVDIELKSLTVDQALRIAEILNPLTFPELVQQPRLL